METRIALAAAKKRLLEEGFGHVPLELDRSDAKRDLRNVRAAMQSRSLCLSLLCVFALAMCDSARTAETAPTIETILDRMAQARAKNQALFRPYTVTRDYKLFGKERQKTKAQVIADVVFVPPASKNYAIQQTHGAGIGERIVRRMLASEAEIAKDYGATDFSTDNYVFRFIREENVNSQPCYVLEMIPKRKDKNLIQGNLWVDASTYLLRRAEGEPAKSPSWWIRNSRVALFYADVDGMWLQTALEGSATVRILGSFTIVSNDVKYEIDDSVADAASGRNRSDHKTGFEVVSLRRGGECRLERCCRRMNNGAKIGMPTSAIYWRPGSHAFILPGLCLRQLHGGQQYFPAKPASRSGLHPDAMTERAFTVFRLRS